MRKTLTALAAAATIAVSALAVPTAAEARWGGGWGGGWHGGGWGGPGPFFGGLAAGAIIGGALASPYYYGGGYPGYYGGGYPAYYAGYGGYSGYGGCWRRHWNGFHWVRTRVC
jgi:hypothetical protein